MPRYFFCLHDRDMLTPDDEGTELPNLEEAYSFAIRAAREVMAHDVLSGRLHLCGYVCVHNFENQRTLKVSFGEALQLCD